MQMLRVAFLSHSSEVTVETVEGRDGHIHDKDPNYTENPSSNFRWTSDMSKIVMEGVVKHAKPNVILRN